MRISYALLLSLLILSACDAVSRLGYQTDLYQHHTNEFRNPDGKEARDIGYEYNAPKNSETLNTWRQVMADLVTEMERTYGVPAKGIYLVPHQNRTAFTNTYDHVLRQELLRRGYDIRTTAEEGVPKLYYQAAVDKDYKTHEHADLYNGDQKSDLDNTYEDRRIFDEAEYQLITFRLTLNIRDEDQALVKTSAIMPIYGYKDTEAIYPNAFHVRYLKRQPTVNTDAE